MTQCPLCNSTNVTKLENIKRTDLIRLYNSMGVNVEKLLNSDIDYCLCNVCELFFYSPLVTGDEEFYNSLQHHDWYYSDEKEEFKFSKGFIKDTDKVLEIGSGKGAFAKFLQTKNYIGLDFSENAKKMAAENGIHIENQSIEMHADANPSVYDVVCSFQVLEHVSNPAAFIQAKLKALKSGGLLIIAVPAENSFLRYTVNAVLNMPPHHVTRWTDESLQYVASIHGLQCVALHHEHVQSVHTGWYFSTLIRNALLKPALIDLSFTGRFITRLANLMAKMFARVDAPWLLSNGHTITVVYRKP